ncbi:hypothetical protein [Natranaerobius thermophilus]|uniref:Uncharacterized protein n=1 Tax=Natranaerobius thermophilus (strain ATCC BAA-1301 / DSM 18059 / JW/NM-WN-LF) TaxID=457570 RepID=B2A752_NATTJ|nr:hypothetical protein [Natranaerobius thermophilus]ACB85643.1 hypothetical protein Nther_2076 [Natranaerobius thermophilus JW/NM-WN-LF]
MFFEINKVSKVNAIQELIKEHLTLKKQKELLDWLQNKVETEIYNQKLCFKCLNKMRYGGYVIDKRSKRKKDGSFEKLPTYLKCSKCGYWRSVD